MTTPQPSEAKEWSPEPWRFSICGGTKKPAVYAQSGTLKVADVYGYLHQSEANAARIVACVNFCAGVPSEELAKHPAAYWIERANDGFSATSEAAHLRAQLSEAQRRNLFDSDAVKKLSRRGAIAEALDAYVYELTGNEGEDDALAVLKTYVKDLQAAEQSAKLNEKLRMFGILLQHIHGEAMVEYSSESLHGWKAAFDDAIEAVTAVHAERDAYHSELLRLQGSPDQSAAKGE